ncbi:MAG: hypothetical protein ACYS0D_05440 [Planctomycetota bacterium]
MPVFLAVSSVLTQYVYLKGVRIDGAYGDSLGDPLWSVGGGANLTYIERPTITYAPLVGDEFASQLLRPISSEVVFSLVQSGWPPEDLLVMTLYRFNDLVNVPFEPSAPGENLQRLQRFREVMGRIVDLHKRGGMEVQRDDETDNRTIVFSPDPDPETRRLIEDFKADLGMAPDVWEFRMTEKRTRRAPDEVTVRVRSVLELMAFLSQGVEIPAVHIEKERAESIVPATGEDRSFRLLHVRSQPDPPQDAFVAVRFQDHWFYIAHSDHESKQAFSLITYLYQMQAPQAPTAGPLLTVPTG